MRQKFLEEHYPGTYAWLILSGKLWAHLVDIDTACEERMDTLIPSIAKQEGVTETLQAGGKLVMPSFPLFFRYLLV